MQTMLRMTAAGLRIVIGGGHDIVNFPASSVDNRSYK